MELCFYRDSFDAFCGDNDDRFVFAFNAILHRYMLNFYYFLYDGDHVALYDRFVWFLY